MGFAWRALISLLVGCILLTVNPFRQGFDHPIDATLEFIIDYLSDLRSELQADLSSSNSKTAKLRRDHRLSNDGQRCPNHSYTTRIIHRDPLIIYIENFLTPAEIDHLLELTKDSFQRSSVYTGKGNTLLDESRTSTSAGIDRRETPMVACIEQRFAQFQGIAHVDQIEPLQMVNYGSDQQAKAHYDWFTDVGHLDDAGQRITTFFTYLQANCTHGETEFMEIPFDPSIHRSFCGILTCDEHSSKHGLRFRPIPGNTLFWFNVDFDGNGEHATLHAGLPPGPNGHKIGLNTWTRERILDLSQRRGFPQPLPQS